VPDPDTAVFTGNRIASQRAKVCKTDSAENSEDVGIKASNTADDLSMGLHYMRSLGAEPAPSNGGGNGSSLSNIRSSFTSLESSYIGNKTGTELSMTKVLIRAGEGFKFRVPIFPTKSGTTVESYVVKLISGQVLPKFIQPDLRGISTKGVLELSGVATFRDIGTLSVGVYTNTGDCVASVIIEVVGK
jgi:axial budding pattern protein 2